MTIRQKTILTAALVLLVALGLITLLSSRVILRGFDQLETQSALEDAARLRAAVEDQLDQLDITAHDWASWDDCYAFVEDGNEAFRLSTVAEEPLKALGLSAIAFIHVSGRIPFATGIEWPEGRLTPLPHDILEQWRRGGAIRREGEETLSKTGFLIEKNRIYFFAARPILTSQGKGPLRGTLIMAREASPEWIEQLEQKTKRPLACHRLPSTALPPDVAAWAVQPSAVETPFLPKPGKTERSAYVAFNDLHGAPAFLVQLRLHRDIYSRALRVLFLHNFVIILITVISGVVLIALMEKLVLSRIARLGDELRTITSRQNSDLRVPVEGRDEIALLSQTVNDMLESLSQVQHHLRETEKEFRDIISNLDMLVVLLDTEGSVIFCNGLAVQSTGWSVDDLIGANWFDAVQPSDSEAGNQYRTRIADRAYPARYETSIETRSGSVRRISWSGLLMHDSFGRVIGSANIGQDITDTARAEKELMRIRAAIDDTSDAIAVANEVGEVIYLNVAFSNLLKQTIESLAEVGLAAIFDNRNQGEAIILDTMRGGHWRDEIALRSGDGQLIPALVGCTPILDDDFAQVGLAMTIIDLTAQKQAEEERRRMEAHLMQSQKLESVGQLAAGIAHEINTPIQFIGDNLQFLDTAFTDLLRLIADYMQMRKAAEQIEVLRKRAEQIIEAEERADLAYLEAEIPKAVSQSREGITRVADIVRAMKEFSHPSTEEKTLVDLNRAIETTVTIARNEWKYIAEVNLDLDTTLSHISCLPGDLNQVLLNLIVNAAHAIADARKEQADRKGVITISTRRLDDDVEIRVADTGTGISDEHRPRIFEPFFTTKDVGRGTGQGLYMARNVIVKKHGGTIRFETETGVGTTFIINLPIGGYPA